MWFWVLAEKLGAMFVLPLGLDTHTRRLPWMTALIVLVTVLYSIFRFDSFHADAKTRLNSAPARDLFRARSILAIKACDQTTLTPKDCRFLKESVSTSSSENPLIAFTRLSGLVRKTYGKEARSKIEIFQRFLIEDTYWRKADAVIKALPEYAKYAAAFDGFREEVSQVQKTNRILSKSNLNLMSLIDAQFSHAGWMHLIGNMLLFLLLALPLEERVGPMKMFAIYILGGAFGLGMQIVIFKDLTMPLLGASASVCAMAGLFLALFFRAQMRVWVSYFFVWNKTATMPTFVFIPIFLVTNDIAGMMVTDTNVAHFAHLTGFFFGLVCGYAVTKINPLPASHTFPFEQETLAQALNTEQTSARLRLIHEVLCFNRRNEDAQELLILMIEDNKTSTWDEAPETLRRATTHHFETLFEQRLNGRPTEDVISFLERMPTSWPLQESLKKVNLARIQKAIAVAERDGKIEVEIQLLRIFASFVTQTAAQSEAQSRIERLERKITHAAAVS